MTETSKCAIRFKSEFSETEISEAELCLIESIFLSIIASTDENDRLDDD